MLSQPTKGTKKRNLKPIIILLSIATVLLGGYLIYGFATLKTPTTEPTPCKGNYVSTDGTYCDGEYKGVIEPTITTDENGNIIERYVAPVE